MSDDRAGPEPARDVRGESRQAKPDLRHWQLTDWVM